MKNNKIFPLPRITWGLIIMLMSYSEILISQDNQTPIPISIGGNLELFVDDFLIDSMKGGQLELHSPIDEGEVLSFDKPWEGAFSAYVTVLKDGDLYKAYYRGIPEAGKDGNEAEVTCYAESDDGMNWVKPNLGIHTIDGSSSNNVILANAAPITHNFSPFIDQKPGVPASEKYKAMGGTAKSGLVAYVSSDGINWKRLKENAVFNKGVFDSQNVAFWSESEGQYVCYFRTWTGGGYNGFRSVSRTTSKDFCF